MHAVREDARHRRLGADLGAETAGREGLFLIKSAARMLTKVHYLKSQEQA